MQSQEKDFSLVNNLSFSRDEIEAFRRQGFIKLKGFLSERAIQSLKQAARSKVISARESKSAYGDSFSRLTYDLGTTDAVKNIYSSIAFRTALVTLIGHPLIMTESQSFELTPPEFNT
ncbi:hypothetical protein [Pseudomonas fluorescens]|uniref:Phytanoyl-CoA dioxygenase n=1 Tax=Pseudomonas fluorescens TaxID=294 RepID=A0A109KLK0_PSEFL|nr:hypothetical protein [Pseudomonas fluorescens]KWV71422.1 hypothetical protein PFL603g_06105 [Pseudomonas fluorescens]